MLTSKNLLVKEL